MGNRTDALKSFLEFDTDMMEFVVVDMEKIRSAQKEGIVIDSHAKMVEIGKVDTKYQKYPKFNL